MGKKKACQNVKVPRPLNAVEQGLYGWVEESIFTRPSVLEDSLPELRCRMSLTEDAAAEERSGDAVSGGSEPAPFKWLGSPADLRAGLPSFREFKWHYFKVLSALGRRAFWLDDRGDPFPWVYWNRGVKDFVIHSLDPLETAAFDFLVSLPVGLPKNNNFTCRWILDNPDAVVGKFLGNL
ncbi:hypothetical protein PIB30_013226 [Stylosanthes scabra]|uniref:Uncharacterized protein n=1 Tax=Stylosanthes scabra TaxID=79078 RepID=A0ABU6Q6A9_9FABA|nr:hypothetical protein [Stylosanthes scabra]